MQSYQTQPQKTKNQKKKNSKLRYQANVFEPPKTQKIGSLKIKRTESWEQKRYHINRVEYESDV